MKRYQMLISGEAVDASTGKFFPTASPYTGDPWAEIPHASAQDVDGAVRAAHQAFRAGPWADMTPSQRGLLLHRFADLVAREAARLAETEVRDNGKLYAEMHAQLAYLPNWFRYYGGLADKIEGSVIPLDKKGYFNFTRREPIGVIAVITPWNSPLMLTGFKIAPALAAGCTVVIKPSEFTSASTLEFAALAKEAGFPPGVINVVTGFGHDVGAALVEHPLVAGISFTGADTTGRHINQVAARGFKHATLELGGKSPNIVFADANLDDALNGAISGIFAATGQTCIAGSRLLLQDSIHDQFLERLVARARSARMGDPMEAQTQVGPVTTPPQFRKVLEYIDVAKADGARLLLGGRPADRPECGKGWFVEPTIFGDVTQDMRIAQEEVFGPVLSVMRFRAEEEAVRIANSVRFGLASGVWTSDMARAFRLSERLQSGTVWINTYRAVSYMSPFGGYKDSGVGRENGIHAMDEYLQTKSVWINTGAKVDNPFVIR